MDNIRYSETHEWIQLVEDHVLIGITNYAQSRLGSIVFVDLPTVYKKVSKGEEIGAIESVKAASEIFSPVSGQIIHINEQLLDQPELLNNDPVNTWIVKVKIDNIEEFNALLDKSQYEQLIK
jgi:glycine cleavage system H protein